MGMTQKTTFRIIPVAVALLAWTVWTFVLLRKTRFYFQNFLFVAIALLLLYQPAVKEWHQCLHAHSYLLSLILITVAVSFRITHAAPALALIGFIAGWTNYDWMPSVVITAFVARWSYHSVHGHSCIKRWRLASLEALACIGGIIFAIFTHLLQNALYYNSWTAAWKDLLGAAATRAKIDTVAKWNPGYYTHNKSVIIQKELDRDRFLTVWYLWKHLQKHFFSAGNMKFFVAGCLTFFIGTLTAARTKKLRFSRCLECIPIALLIALSGITWSLLMPWHACCHFHVIYRHLLTPFILVISLLVFFTDAWVKENRFSRKYIIEIAVCFCIALLIVVWIYGDWQNTTHTDSNFSPGKNVAQNSTFADNHAHWQHWRYAKQAPQYISIQSPKNVAFNSHILRIENPEKQLIGLAQNIQLVSGKVYRISAYARSTGATDSEQIFGGRLAVWMPQQKEQELVWMSNYDKWWRKSYIFTNTVSGSATFYVHMGYGNVASTGEFADVKCELIE
jgi:hypothetical protein